MPRYMIVKLMKLKIKVLKAVAEKWHIMYREQWLEWQATEAGREGNSNFRYWKKEPSTPNSMSSENTHQEWRQTKGIFLRGREANRMYHQQTHSIRKCQGKIWGSKGLLEWRKRSRDGRSLCEQKRLFLSLLRFEKCVWLKKKAKKCSGFSMCKDAIQMTWTLVGRRVWL